MFTSVVEANETRTCWSSGHTITSAAKNSLPHPCPCAVEDMPAADSDGLTTLP